MKRLSGMIWAVLAVIAVPFTAYADEDAERFVAENGALAVSILGDDSLSLDDKKLQFRSLVDEVIDVKRVSRFVLGNFAKAASNRFYDDQDTLNADMDVFRAVFREYAVGVYETQLGNYGGQTFQVLGSTTRRQNDYIVHSVVSGVTENDALPVNWRVIRRDGTLRVVDVEVYDVWLAVNQRDEIVGFVREGRGDINAATQALQAVIDARAAEAAAKAQEEVKQG